MYKDNQFNRKINRVGMPYGSTCPKWDEPEPKVRKIKVKRKKKEPEPEPVVRKIKVKRKKKEKVLPAQPIMTPLVAEQAPRMGLLDAPREVFDVPDRLAPLPPPLQQPRKSLMEQELEMGMGMGMGGGTFMVNTITGDTIEVPIIDGISPVAMVKRVEPDVGNIQLLDDDGNEVKAVVDGMMVNMIVLENTPIKFKTGDRFWWETPESWLRINIVKRTPKEVRIGIFGRDKRAKQAVYDSYYENEGDLGRAKYGLPFNTRIKTTDDGVEYVVVKPTRFTIGRLYANRDRERREWGETEIID